MRSPTLTILIIDDCSEDRATYRRFLNEHASPGYHILEADSGIEGWELAHQENPDCIFLDSQLPDFDGLDFVTSFVREQATVGHIPTLIMLIGQGDESIAAQALSSGARDYLVKGNITSDGFHRTITHALEKTTLLCTMAEQRGAIERSQQELEQFAYTLCHDLQAPVRRIINFLELFQKEMGGEVRGRSQEYLDRTIHNACHVRQFIQDILAFSLIGGDTNPPEPVDLNTIVRNVIGDLDGIIQETHAQVQCDHLPTVEGQSRMFHQLFQNLIGNALKYRGTEPPLIQITSRLEDTTWHCQVKDNGIGIEHEGLEPIFTVFHRLHTKSQYEGSGIGLALCKKIVERLGGRIWVESEKGLGATFHFTMSLANHSQNLPKGSHTTQEVGVTLSTSSSTLE